MSHVLQSQDVDEAHVKQAISQVQALCKEGSAHAGRGDSSSAASCYEQGLECAEALVQARPAILRLRMGAAIWGGFARELPAMQLVMLTGLAVCHLRGQLPERPPDPAKALAACQRALAVDPRCVRAAFCRYQALARLGRHAEAEEALERAGELDPKSTAIAREREALRQRAREASAGSSSAAGAPAAGEPAGSAPARQAAGQVPAPMPYAPPSTSRDVPLNFTGERGVLLNFPSPLATIGFQAIDYMAAQIATKLESAGTAAYAWELMRASQRVVDLQFGQGAVSRIERLGRCFWMIGRQLLVEGYEQGKGQRRLSLSIDGLVPEQPFHDPGDHPWCAELAKHRGAILAELKEQAGSPLWRDMGDSGQLAAEWRSITVVKHGLWAVAGAFPRTQAALRSLPGVRPMEVFLARMPPHTEIRPHSDETNFLLNAHLGLELEEGPCTLTVGECTRAWREGGVLVFDHSYVHSAANASGRDRYVLACRFWHPGCSDEEAYVLAFVSVLLECIVRQGRVRAVFEREGQAAAPGPVAPERL